MRGSVFGLVPVVDSSGPELDVGELVTWLNDAVLLAPSMLLRPGVEWAAVDERVEELIEFMGLQAFRDKFTNELSTGSRRIVDLACILAHQPTVLLLDEPSSGIAQREAEALGPLMLRIRDQLGATLLVIEHDLPLLSSVSDRMVGMDLGRVIAVGTPTEVVNDPVVVASYLGDNEAAIARSGDRS